MAAGGSNDIDSLKFSVVLDTDKFEKEMKRVEGLTEKFEKSVRDALAITNLLDAAQGKGVKATKEKAEAQKQVALLTRQELEAKRAAGTITEKELKQLKQLIAADKALLDEENKKLTAQKKALDIESKTLTIQKKKEAAERSHAGAVEATNKHVMAQSALMRQITSYMSTYVSIFGAVALVRNMVRITGEFEAQRAALRAILMDAAGADRIFYQLQELAVKSPYTFRDLTSYAKQLSAFSVPMDEIYETTKKLADVSAGLGVDMSRIILAYGQVRSASFLRGQEVRQFTEAGIPILAELAKQFEEIEGHAVSTGEVFDRISKRQVPFEMVEEAFRRMTAEGGKFYNMQEVLAATVKGKISNLQDSWEIMLSKIGDANSGLIKGSLSLLTELIKNYEKLGAVILEVTVAYGAYKATLAATNALQSAAAVSTRFLAVTGERVTSLEVLTHRLFRTTGSGLAKIGKFIAKNPYAIAIAAVAAGITALILHLRKMNEHLRETDKITSKAIGQAEASKSNIHYYIQRLKEAKEGTEEYNKARQDVIDQAGNFISATDAERLSLENVDDVWVNICNHIEEAMKLQAMQSVTAEAEARKQEKQMGVMEKLADYQQKHGLTNEVRQIVASFIRREITEDELKRQLSGKLNDTDAWATFHGSEMGALLWNADKWWNDFYAAEREYYASIARARSNLKDVYGSGTAPSPAGPSPLEGWRVAVDQFVKDFGGGNRGMEVTNATDLASYIKKGADALNAARDALKHTPKNDPGYKKLEEDIRFYEGISEAIYGVGHTEFDNTTRKYKTEQKQLTKDQRERLAGYKQQVDDLKTIYSTYKAIAPMFTDEYGNLDESGLAKVVGNLFGDTEVPKNMEEFAAAFTALAESIEPLDENAAKDVMNLIAGITSKDMGSKYNASAAAARRFSEFLDTMGTRTSNIFGEGIQRKALELASSTDKANARIDAEAAKRRRELLASQFAYEKEGHEKTWDEYLKDGLKAIETWAENEKKVNKETAQAKLKDMAQAYLTEQLKSRNINLQDWGDKSLAQVRDIFRDLKGLMEDSTIEKMFDEKAREKLKADGYDLSELMKEILRLLGLYMKEAEQEGWKKASKIADSIADSFTEMGSALEKAADSFDDISSSGYKVNKSLAGVFTQIGSGLSTLSGMSETLEKVKSGESASAADAFSAGAKLLSMVANAYSSVIQAQQRLKKETEEWEATLRKAAYELINIQMDSLDFSEKNPLYSSSVYEKAASATNKFRQNSEKMMELYKTIAGGKTQVGQKQVIDGLQTGAGAGMGALVGAASGAIIGSAVPVIGTAIGAIVGGIIGLIAGGVGAGAQSAHMEPIFGTLQQKYGNLLEEGTKTFALKAEIMAEYAAGKLDEATSAAIAELEELRANLQEAVDLVNESITDVVGDLSKTLSDEIAEAFTNGNIYDAIDSFHDYLTNAIQDLVMQVAMSRFVQPLLDQLYEGMLGSVGMKLDEDGNPYYIGGGDNDYTDDLKKFEDGLAEVMPGLEAYLEAAKGAMYALGEYDIFSPDAGGKKNTLGNGIKSITEDTANLLASYLNAIRADVSYGKTQWERIAVAVEGQNGRYITLNDYMQQVAANTFDTAQNTQRLVERVDAFIRDFSMPSSLGESIKVQVVNN